MYIYLVPSLLLAVTFMLMQEKYEEAIASLAEMEKRVVMAESMLEATLQYQSGQSKAQPSPRCVVNLLPFSNLLCLGGKIFSWCVGCVCMLGGGGLGTTQ